MNYDESEPLSEAIASISSKNIILGEEILAFLEKFICKLYEFFT